MAETISLDPAAVATSRTAFDITPFISSDGVDWDDASIESYQADGLYGGSPVDFRIPNRHVVAPLHIAARGTVTFEQARRQLQAKVALFQREGGWISRVTGAGTMYADVVNASLKLGGDWIQANKSVDVNAQLSLELKPDWYGAEVTLDDATETSAPAFVKVLKLSAADAVIAGDFPPRVRMVVDEDQAQAQLGLIWGYRSRYYDSAATAGLLYWAGSLTPLDTAGTLTLSGAWRGTAVRHNSLGVDWTPVLSTQILSGTAHMTHKGTYRVWGRFYSTSATPPDVRFVWDVGDLTYPATNDQKTIPGSSGFYQVDLGEVRLDPAPVGTHRWKGVVQAKGASGGENVYVDTIAFQPIDDGAGRLMAPITSDPGLVSYVARDEFNQSAGTITGQVLPVGGTWVGSGATDFTVDASNHWLTRSNTNARFITAGTANFAAIVVQADVSFGQMDQPRTGVLARYTASDTWLLGAASMGGVSSTTAQVSIQQKNTGVTTFIRSAIDVPGINRSAWYTIRLLVTTSGDCYMWFFPQNSAPGDPILTGTGATIAAGRPGIYDDGSFSGGLVTHQFDNFAAWVPDLDAVLNASQSAELRTEGMFREDASGIAYGNVTSITGTLPRLPVSGLESRKVEVFIKASRGDFDTIPDSGIDDISMQAFYRPCWLNAPGS